ncbi:MAG: glycosyltransferase [Clostridia bacterium]|nr:glycosyltransferase [Clostridia bacterium]
MILVMLGTQKNSFHRLLEEIQKCIDKGIIKDEVIVQAGSTKFESKDMKIFNLISNAKLKKLVKEADLVITHGGVGSIVTALKEGKKVIAVPRYHEYNEHVNDHQLEIVQTFDGQGFIKGAVGVSDLSKLLKEAEKFTPKKFVSNNENIINMIEKFIDSKKLLFAAHSLDVGGIEKALVTLVNKLDEEGHKITLVLEKKQGIFLDELNSNIEVIEYAPNTNKNIIIRKVSNLIKRIKFTLKYKNKFDFAGCFATYSIPASVISKIASKNNALWGHADYLTLYDNNKEKVKEFFNARKYNKFKHIIFVSEEGKNSFIKIFPEMQEKTIVCNNLIDYNKIKDFANEKIETKKDSNCVTFLNVGRHDEKQKRLTRLIEASNMLKNDGFNFKILLVGDGPDNNKYKEMVEKYKLEDKIIFLGSKQNPYPYFKISDCIILTSEYEGYPVVFLESFTLNKPIITTKVSDYKQVEDGFGYVTEKDSKDIYEKMKLFIEKGFTINKKFKPEEYNNEIMKKLEEIF